MSKFLLLTSLLVTQLAAVSAQAAEADAAPRRLRRKFDLFQVEDKAAPEDDKARKLHVFAAEFDNELESDILDGEDGEWNRLLQDGSMSMSMPATKTLTKKAHGVSASGKSKMALFD